MVQEPLVPLDQTAITQVQLEHFELTHRPSFVEYLQGGIQISFITAIDFTASNERHGDN